MDGIGESVLRIRELRVVYAPASGPRVRALDGFELDLRGGEVFGLLGESGSGKSTLTNAVMGTLPRNIENVRGEIVFRERDLLKVKEAELQKIRGREIALIGQDPATALNPVMKVGTQIAEVLRAHLPLSSGARRERTVQLLGELGFEDPQEICSAYPHQLSGGQRQRVAIAQAICCRPSVLIADEATSKLDASLQAETMALLLRIREKHGITIVLITHDPNLVRTFADRVGLMYAGRMVEIGGVRDWFARPLHPYSRGLVQIARSGMDGALKSKRRFEVIPGDSFDRSEVEEGCRFAARCVERMELCRKRDPRGVAPEPGRLVSCLKYEE